jgi:hypothetical protein
VILVIRLLSFFFRSSVSKISHLILTMRHPYQLGYHPRLPLRHLPPTRIPPFPPLLPLSPSSPGPSSPPSLPPSFILLGAIWGMRCRSELLPQHNTTPTPPQQTAPKTKDSRGWLGEKKDISQGEGGFVGARQKAGSRWYQSFGSSCWQLLQRQYLRA